MTERVVAMLESYGRNDNYTGCDVGWILLSALKYLSTENAKMQADDSCPVVL